MRYELLIYDIKSKPGEEYVESYVDPPEYDDLQRAAIAAGINPKLPGNIDFEKFKQKRGEPVVRGNVICHGSIKAKFTIEEVR